MGKSSQVRPLGASSCLLKGADCRLEKCEDAEQLLMLHPLQSSICILSPFISIELNCFRDFCGPHCALDSCVNIRITIVRREEGDYDECSVCSTEEEGPHNGRLGDHVVHFSRHLCRSRSCSHC